MVPYLALIVGFDHVGIPIKMKLSSKAKELFYDETLIINPFLKQQQGYQQSIENKVSRSSDKVIKTNGNDLNVTNNESTQESTNTDMKRQSGVRVNPIDSIAPHILYQIGSIVYVFPILGVDIMK